MKIYWRRHRQAVSACLQLSYEAGPGQRGCSVPVTALRQQLVPFDVFMWRQSHNISAIDPALTTFIERISEHSSI